MVLQFVRVVETRRKQEEEELCPHAGAAASPGLSPSSSARDAVSGLLPLHMPGLLHQAWKTESLCRGKHFIMDSPGEGWIQRTCSSAFLNQGWLWLCENHKCLLASVGRESPRLVLSRPHGRFIGMDPLSWSTVVRHPEQKMELNPTVLNLFHTGRSQRKRERRRHTDTHTHRHTRDLLLAKQSASLPCLVTQKEKGH